MIKTILLVLSIGLFWSCGTKEKSAENENSATITRLEEGEIPPAMREFNEMLDGRPETTRKALEQFGIDAVLTSEMMDKGMTFDFSEQGEKYYDVDCYKMHFKNEGETFVYKICWNVEKIQSIEVAN